MKSIWRAAFDINNPCGHTNLKTDPCSICGFPDPRITITSLREEIVCLKAELTELNNWSDQLWKTVSPQDPATTDALMDWANGTKINGGE